MYLLQPTSYYCALKAWALILIYAMRQAAGSRIERSAEEYRQHHLHADMRFSAAVKTTIIEHHVRVYGDTAVSIARSHTLGTYKGKQIDKQGNETLVLNLINGHWKISHIHWSH